MVQNVKHRSNKSFEQLFFCSEDVDEGKCKPEMCQMEANYSGDILAW